MRLTVRDLTRAAMLLALAVVAQTLSKVQLVTGSAVNAVLLLSVPFVGPVAGVLIGLLTPLLALLTGNIAGPAAPFVPFIMIGNALIVIAFAALRKVNTWFAAAAGAVLKFAWLTLSANQIAALFGIKLPPKLIAAFGLTQLYTALIGGAIAVIIISLPAFNKAIQRSN